MARRKALLSRGLCTACGKNPLVTKDRCLPCSRVQAARQHGLTPQAYSALLEAGCRVCGSTEDLHVDHDHACCGNRNKDGCGKCVRGALCRLHNTQAGWIEHPDVMKVIAYLAETHSASPLVALYEEAA